MFYCSLSVCVSNVSCIIITFSMIEILCCGCCTSYLHTKEQTLRLSQFSRLLKRFCEPQNNDGRQKILTFFPHLVRVSTTCWNKAAVEAMRTCWSVCPANRWSSVRPEGPTHSPAAAPLECETIETTSATQKRNNHKMFARR